MDAIALDFHYPINKPDLFDFYNFIMHYHKRKGAYCSELFGHYSPNFIISHSVSPVAFAIISVESPIDFKLRATSSAFFF